MQKKHAAFQCLKVYETTIIYDKTNKGIITVKKLKSKSIVIFEKF